MSFAKTVPEGLKWIERERGVGGKNFSMRYIPQQDPMQEALEKNKMTTYFKLTLPNMGNGLKVAVWASRTPKQFLLHVRSVIHACTQMGLDTSFTKATTALKSAMLDVELTKGEYVQQSCNSEEKKGKGNKGGESDGTP